jgi:hypothetical protein
MLCVQVVFFLMLFSFSYTAFHLKCLKIRREILSFQETNIKLQLHVVKL